VAGKVRAHGEGTIYKAGNRWVGEISLGGQRRRVSGRTKTDAAAKLKGLRDEYANPTPVPVTTTVAELLADWQVKRLPGRGLAPSTVETHRWAIALWTEYLGGVPLSSLDAPTVEAALAKMAAGKGDPGRRGRGKPGRSGPLGRASLIKARSTLHQALKWAQGRGVLDRNPAAVAELPLTPADGVSKRALTEAEFAKLREAMRGDPYEGLVVLLAKSGLRPGEAFGLCAGAVDLGAGTIAVRRAVRHERGVPRLVDDLKTSASARRLVVGPDVVRVLREQIPLAEPATGLLWTAEGGGPVHGSTFRKVLRAACQTAGIEPIAPNELRHSSATWMVARGVSPVDLADVLGHRSTRMIEQHYRHAPSLRRGAEVLADL
jgi:integrase